MAWSCGIGLVRFVDEQQIILRKIIEQRGRGFAGQAAGHVPRIIFDAVAIADGAHHLDVKHGALPHALRLRVFALLLRVPASTSRALRGWS